MNLASYKAFAVISALSLAACGGEATSENAAVPNSTGEEVNASAPAETTSEAPQAESGGGGAAEGAAVGAQQDFAIINNTGQTVRTLNVSASDQNEWGPDILGQNVLPDGERGQVSFVRGQEQCNWDIRATFENGDTGDWRSINLCETATITLTEN